jgi:hypothetical protein
MHLQVLNGYFLEDHAVWGEPSGSSILSGIHSVDFPDLSVSGDQALTDLAYDIRLMLGCLKPDECLQLNLVGSGPLGGKVPP